MGREEVLGSLSNFSAFLMGYRLCTGSARIFPAIANLDKDQRLVILNDNVNLTCLRAVVSDQELTAV